MCICYGDSAVHVVRLLCVFLGEFLVCLEHLAHIDIVARYLVGIGELEGGIV